MSAKILLAVTLLAVSAPVGSETPAGAIPWRDWSPDVFAEARREGRFVLLDLGAVWCHWCHVMDETTYRDHKVIELVSRRYVAVRVDQDARPDLSNRYEDYGWPATVIFAADGTELVKFSGYVPPRRMASLLQGVIEDPTPGPSASPEEKPTFAEEAALSPTLRSELEGQLVARYDREQGGWGFAKKFLDWDAVEYSLARVRAGDREAEGRARETLAKQRKLIDPVWGGVYQYSDSGDWEHPHFERLLQFQAENLRIYAQAYALWHEPAHLQAARDIHRYLRAFLMSPEGAFYVSQDADLVRGEHGGDYFALDDAERRKRGIPRVDTHLYARETGWAATALVALQAATGEAEPLAEARRAAEWILARRALPGGGFRHDERDVAGPYLGDTLGAARAFLALYGATGERAWLRETEAAVEFIERTFRAEPGYSTARSARGERPQRDENVQLARLANLLFHYTGKAEHRAAAERALRFLTAPEIAKRFETGGVLLADLELRTEPLHVTVVGPRDDAGTQSLLRAAAAIPVAYKRVELLDAREGPLPRSDVTYPRLGRPAAFVCTEGRCSAPSFTADELASRLRRHLSQPGPDPAPSAPVLHIS